MNATFSMGTVSVADEKGNKSKVPVEMVNLTGGFLGKDVVTRPASDQDRFEYKAEYEEFRKTQEPAGGATSAEPLPATGTVPTTQPPLETPQAVVENPKATEK